VHKTALPARQARSRETLARLLRATVEVLDTEGLEGATIPRIAARAGVTPGAIYRRFPDKDTLLREVCLRVLAENYRQSQELLSPERWADKPLVDLCRSVVEQTLSGHARHRGLVRAIILFTAQHPDAAFVRQSEELQWRVFRAISELLLTRRHEIRHPDPDAAVPFALLMVVVAAKGVLVLPRDPKLLSRAVPDVEARLHRELPTMVLRYLGIDM
jgi:AcrR family transcriptional regulator